jgi:hypothetical protein
MSSARSIAAARNRRAGESTPQPNQNTFQQQYIQQQQQYIQPQFIQQQLPKNMKVNPQQQQQQKQVIPETPINPVEEMRSRVPVGKISISDAFALVTVRLGRVESMLEKIESGETELGNSELNSLGGRSDDNVVIRSIISRIEDLEKKGNTPNKMVDTKIIALNDKISALHNEVRQIKDLLFKLQSFTIETNQKVLNLAASASAPVGFVASEDEVVVEQEEDSNVVDDSIVGESSTEVSVPNELSQMNEEQPPTQSENDKTNNNEMEELENIIKLKVQEKANSIQSALSKIKIHE